LSILEQAVLFLALAALATALLVLLRVALQLGGAVLPRVKICSCHAGRLAPAGCFTPPWRRALGQLFTACDADRDGALSLAELRDLANKTGEVVTEEMLKKVLKVADHTGLGLTPDGLAQTYGRGDGSVVLADLDAYGMSQGTCR